MKKRGIDRSILYLAAIGFSVLSVIQSQDNLLPKIVGILVYVLAAILLTGAFICLYKDLRNGIIEKFLTTVKKNSFGAHFLEDYRFRTILTTMPSFMINVAYTIYNGVIGIMNQSSWFITMAVYYSLLGIMRYCAVHTERKISRLEDHELIRKKELAVIKIDGILLLLLNLALSGVVLLTIAEGTAKAYSDIMAISIAAYTFYKIIMAMLTLQMTMLVSFQGTDSLDMNRMNGITGLAVCLLISALGISMIYYAFKRKES